MDANHLKWKDRDFLLYTWNIGVRKSIRNQVYLSKKTSTNQKDLNSLVKKVKMSGN